jgi:hypothetical protein
VNTEEADYWLSADPVERRQQWRTYCRYVEAAEAGVETKAAIERTMRRPPSARAATGAAAETAVRGDATRTTRYEFRTPDGRLVWKTAAERLADLEAWDAEHAPPLVRKARLAATLAIASDRAGPERTAADQAVHRRLARLGWTQTLA